MAYIESHQELKEHPKTVRLAKLLNVPLPQAIGHLHLLWWWALDYAQDGDLSPYTSEEIAHAARWEGDPDTFKQALQHCGPGDRAGFLEETEAGRLLLHDWEDYAGRLLEKRRQNSERKRLSRARHADVARDDHKTPRGRRAANVPYRNVPNQTKTAASLVPERDQDTTRDEPDPAATSVAAADKPDDDDEPKDNGIDPAGLIVLAWNDLDPASSKSLAATNRSRYKHVQAALSAGVTPEEMLSVVKAMAPRGSPPWEIRKQAVRQHEDAAMMAAITAEEARPP